MEKELSKITGHSLKTCELTIAFVEVYEMKRLNKNFRSKNKVTDILSFSDQGELSWTQDSTGQNSKVLSDSRYSQDPNPWDGKQRDRKTLSKRYGKSPMRSPCRGFLGELVLCGEVVRSQAEDHQLSLQEELGYLLIHGLLHLLGYEHEKGGKKAKIMFELQDRLFEALRKG